MNQNTKKKSMMSKSDRIISSFAMALIICSAALAAACIYYSHLVQGALIIVCDIAIVGVLLLASSSKSNSNGEICKPNKKFDAGTQYIICKSVNWVWSKTGCLPKIGNGENSKAIIGKNGIRFESNSYVNGYTWDEMISYQVEEDKITIGMSDMSSLMLLYLKPLKSKAIMERLQKQGVGSVHA